MEINETGGTEMFAVDLDTRAGRMIAAGHVTVTFTSPSGEHITLTAKARGKDENDKWTHKPLAEALVVFIEVPNSGGWNDKVGKVTRSKGFVADRNADPARVWCARQLLRFVNGEALAPGLQAQESDNCGVCGRELTDPVSIARGIGPTCLGASTGSKHETKVKPEAPTAPAADPQVEAWKAQSDALLPIVAALNVRHNGTLQMDPTPEEIIEAHPVFADFTPETRQVIARNAPATDKSGVPVAVGGWRERQKFLRDELKAEKKAEKAARPSSQGKVFASTGDDIPY